MIQVLNGKIDSSSSMMSVPAKRIRLGNLVFEALPGGNIQMSQTDADSITQITSNSMFGTIQVQHTEITPMSPLTDEELSILEEYGSPKWYEFWKV